MNNSENNFHKSLEKDIDSLSKEINKVQESKDSKISSEKEVVKKTFKNISPESKNYQSNQSSKKKKENRKKNKESFLPDYMEKDDVDPNKKLEVEKLMDLVIHKGILKALKESKKHSPFIQDAFHDALADKLLPELKKRNII